MDLPDELRADFKAMLKDYPDGISNTSTQKYGDVKKRFSSRFKIPLEGIYATGTTSKRVSNLDTRFPQGNQRGQHAPLGLAFLNIAPGHGKGSQADRIKYFRDRAWSTCRKFVTGEERGTTFDGIVLLVQFGNDANLIPAGMLARKDWPLASSIATELKLGESDIEYLEPVSGPSISLPGVVTAPAAAAPSPSVSKALVDSFEASLVFAGLQVPPGLTARIFASLLAKRFLILQGLSGSGKSRVALAVAKWFQEVEDQVELVAVGADWTSNEHVLGYQDALDPSRYRRPVSGALDVILAAKSDPARPYFLVLDEMNLSHVERYFADLLSALESGQPVALHATDEEIDQVPPRLILPPNLFVIGTVNIDETTYMFSPKVLDRANVIEFRVDRADLETFLKKPGRADVASLEGHGKQYGKLFVAGANQNVAIAALPTSIGDGPQIAATANGHLIELFRELAPHGWEFGFRVANDVHRFIYWHAMLSGSGWTLGPALDAQVVQKIMPKLHGSEHRLRSPIDALIKFATAQSLPLSQAKAMRMAERLRDGFTSFAEA